MGILFIILGVVIVWVILAEGGSVFPRAGQPAVISEENPLEILSKRYARGDLNRTEYEQRRRDLLS